MINALFLVPLYFYEIKEWDRKKKALLSRVNKSNFGYLHANTFQTDRGNEKNRYALDFEGIFREELDQFKKRQVLTIIECLIFGHSNIQRRMRTTVLTITSQLVTLD